MATVDGTVADVDGRRRGCNDAQRIVAHAATGREATLTRTNGAEAMNGRDPR